MTRPNDRAILLFMQKGEETKKDILDAGLMMVSKLGFEGVSIGALANMTNMSKSGLFAHFQSKENLQIELLKYAGQLFAERIIIPAVKVEAGIPRIKALVENWIKWETDFSGGCIYASASAEFSDRPGKVRDLLFRQQEEWIDCLSRIGNSAVKAGVFKEDTDCRQFAFDLYSLLLGFNFFEKLLQDKESRIYQKQSLERLLKSYQK